jgi:hypothetical protein
VLTDPESMVTLDSMHVDLLPTPDPTTDKQQSERETNAIQLLAQTLAW